MSSSISTATALCLAEADIKALYEGRTIAALSRTFINSMPYFALCPADTTANQSTVAIEVWAKFEFCRIYSDLRDLDKLSQLTHWTNETLQSILQERHKLFLSCLKVYRLLQPIEIAADKVSSGKIGTFIKLPTYLSLVDSDPVLNTFVFNKRQEQLINLAPPFYPEIEELDAEVTQFINNCLNDESIAAAKDFHHAIRSILGWRSDYSRQSNSNLDWMNRIAALGDRTLEEDEGKGNYQAGTKFENIVRDSLKFLGFEIDPSHQGGASGIDLFCSAPYPLVGECKSGKKIPNDTAVQLLNLGTKRLPDKETFNKSAKLIIGPGRPTDELQRAAKVHGMAILNPATLEKLVKLHSQYPIDLFELKNYLIEGQADYEVERYINRVLKTVELRKHIVQLVKGYLENANTESADIGALHAVYVVSNPPQPLKREEMYEILVELSSPLTGFLGRRKAPDGQDCFYFLRDMPK